MNICRIYPIQLCSDFCAPDDDDNINGSLFGWTISCFISLSLLLCSSQSGTQYSIWNDSISLSTSHVLCIRFPYIHLYLQVRAQIPPLHAFYLSDSASHSFILHSFYILLSYSSNSFSPSFFLHHYSDYYYITYIYIIYRWIYIIFKFIYPFRLFKSAQSKNAVEILIYYGYMILIYIIYIYPL